VTFAPTLIASYLLGSIPFGILVAKLFGAADVRRSGSGNIGATTVARTVGPLAGMLTLLLDAAKGSAAVWLAARWMGGEALAMVLAGLFAMLGHCFPIWLRFRGGKGVATAAGVFLALCPSAMLAAFILFLLVVGFWRYVSLASIVAAIALPIIVCLFARWGFVDGNALIYFSLLISLLVLWRHRSNFSRLLKGTEQRFNRK